MTNDEFKPECSNDGRRSESSFRHSDFVIPSSFDIRHLAFLRATDRPTPGRAARRA